ncbi:MAG: aminotransferase class I/II-fold pyridoxal phosphate-dependent enzyme [Sphingobacteriales bacterium]|nr:MAG: aminotransferase class I/II-fold pyridoxal phosphate-dependent enzyme [Sphingobacteriales bacterium]
MITDLRSDTVTRPTAGMLQAMMQAEVGDDVFGEDPTVIALEQQTAHLFGMEAGLFCPSGTMANQIAIKVHTRPLDEVVCHQDSHIYQYETGGYAYHSGVGIKLLQGSEGRISPEQITASVNPPFDWLPQTSLVVIENTCNKAGGSLYTIEQMQSISQTCRQHHLALHLDGARIFNALVALDAHAQQLTGLFDSISVCLSKGLGAPVGSVLLGNHSFIKAARRVRKVMGGGMRQAGILAAAGLYALEYHVDRLREDHQRAKILETALQKHPFVTKVLTAYTNIVIFELSSSITVPQFLTKLAAHNVKGIQFGPSQIRFVTHLDFTDLMLQHTLEALSKIADEPV